MLAIYSYIQLEARRSICAQATAFVGSIVLHLELLSTATIQRQHHRRHACPVPWTPRTAFHLCAITSDCCATVYHRHTPPQCLRRPLSRPYARITSQQMYIDPGFAPRKDTTEGTKAAIATTCQQARAEGRVLEGWHNEA